VFPVPHGSRVSDDEGNVHHGVLDADALVGSTSEDKVVSRVGLSSAIWIQPAGGIKFLRVAVDIGILERVVERGNDHAVGGDGIIIGNREGAGSLVGNLQ